MSHQPRRIPRGVIVTGALFLLVVVPGLIFLFWRSGISEDIAQLEQQARNAGEPLSLNELAAWRKPPPDEDNTYVALIDLWEKEDSTYWMAFRNHEQTLPSPKALDVPSQLPLLGAEAGKVSSRLPWTQNQAELIRGFVSADSERADKVRRALQLPRAFFPSTPASSDAGPIPHLPFLRQESHRLVLRGLLATHDKDGTSALDSIEQIVKVAECLREEASTLGQLVRFAIISAAFNALEALFTHAQLTSAQLDRSETLFKSLDVTLAFHQALLGERAMSLRVFYTPIDQLGGLSPNNGETDSLHDRMAGKMNITRSPVNITGFFSLDHRLLLQTFGTLLSLSRAGRWEDILQSEAVIRAAVTAAETFPPKIFTGMILSGQERAVRKFVGIEARRRCALLAIEVERYRSANGGKLPATMELVIQSKPSPLATDPFDGMPLRYRPLPKGYVVYSVGPDRQDQQGAGVAAAGKTEAFDIPFTVEKE